MKDGTTLLAPKAFASGTWGLSLGLLPPTAGWMWQPAQLSRLKRGPRPSATVSDSAKSALPASKSAVCVVLSPLTDLPAPASSFRTPGSLATNCPVADPAVSSTITVIAKPARLRMGLPPAKRSSSNSFRREAGRLATAMPGAAKVLHRQQIRTRREQRRGVRLYTPIEYDAWG